MFKENPYFGAGADGSGPAALLPGTIPVELLVVLTVAAGAVMLFGTLLRRHRPGRGNARPRPRRGWRPHAGSASTAQFDRSEWQSRLPGSAGQDAPAPTDRSELRDPSRQMAAIAKVDFVRRRLLNRAEARILPIIERTIREIGEGHRVMAQTSMGEILRPRDGSGSPEDIEAAFFSINAKRFDFAVFDRFGMLVAAIEYQGAGHYHEGSFMRDAVKREVLRKAGVPFIELEAEVSAQEVARRLRLAIVPDRQVPVNPPRQPRPEAQTSTQAKAGRPTVAVAGKTAP